jgi:hypothetical protein
LIPVIALHSSTLATGTVLMRILPPGVRLPYRVAWLALWPLALLVYSFERRSLGTTGADSELE